jgi:hypothetical protein
VADYLYTATAQAVALTAARKTVLQIATPAAVVISVVRYSITFDGVTASAVPALVTLERQASAGTGGVALTAGYGPNPLDPNTPAGAATALKGPWATTEPVLTSIYEAEYVPPTSGLVYQYPLDQEPVLPASSWIAVVAVATATVNATVTVVWKQ